MGHMEEISMLKFKTRFLILVVILVIFSAIAGWIQYGQPKTKTDIDLSVIPLKIGEWRAEEFLVDKKTKDILETESVLMRRYSRGKESVVLAIVYYKDSRVALHLPESCFSGQGSQIVKRELEPISIPGLDSFSANKLILEGNKGNLVALYFFQTGKMMTHSYQAMRWKMILNKLKSKSNSGALIRFSADIDKNPEETCATLKQFIKEIGPILSQYLQ